MVSTATTAIAQMQMSDLLSSDWLDVQLIVEPMINVRAIEQLVMKTETNKNLLRAICERYNSDRGHKPFFTDFIRGKGEGQIILLHGPPGTGKTLTAGLYRQLISTRKQA